MPAASPSATHGGEQSASRRSWPRPRGPARDAAPLRRWPDPAELVRRVAAGEHGPGLGVPFSWAATARGLHPAVGLSGIRCWPRRPPRRHSRVAAGQRHRRVAGSLGEGVLQAHPAPGHKHQLLRPGRTRWPPCKGRDLDAGNRRTPTLLSAPWPTAATQGLVPPRPRFPTSATRRLANRPAGRLRPSGPSNRGDRRLLQIILNGEPRAIASVRIPWVGPRGAGCVPLRIRTLFDVRLLAQPTKRSDPKDGAPHPANHPSVRHPVRLSSRSHPEWHCLLSFQAVRFPV